jgi:hypothetical protein
LRPSLICAGVDEWTGRTKTFRDEARRRRSSSRRRRRIKRRKMGDVLRCITFITVMGDKHFTALKVPRQCQLVLLVKKSWKQSRSLGSEEGSVLEVDLRECATERKKLRIGAEFCV